MELQPGRLHRGLPLPLKRVLSALIRRYPLEAHLWRTVGQQSAEAQLKVFCILGVGGKARFKAALIPARRLPRLAGRGTLAQGVLYFGTTERSDNDFFNRLNPSR
jgi:hypothetical protein